MRGTVYMSWFAFEVLRAELHEVCHFLVYEHQGITRSMHAA